MDSFSEIVGTIRRDIELHRQLKDFVERGSEHVFGLPAGYIEKRDALEKTIEKTNRELSTLLLVCDFLEDDSVGRVEKREIAVLMNQLRTTIGETIGLVGSSINGFKKEQKRIVRGMKQIHVERKALHSYSRYGAAYR